MPRLAGAAPPNTASARFGATWRIPLLEVALVLLLGVGDAAERRPEVDPDPLRVGAAAVGARRRARRPSSASRPATRPNWLNRSSWRAVLGGIQASGSKSSTCAATCERNGLGSKRSIRLTGERRRGGPARNASSPVPIAVMMPMPVIQTRRRSVMSMDSSCAGVSDRPGSASASARALNVARVRPAIGRVNQRSTNAATTRRAAARSRARSSTRQPPAVGSIRQVTSIPLRGAGDVDEAQAARRRLGPGPRAPGDRQAEPEDRDQRPAGDEVRDERAVGTAFAGPRPDVVGEQPLPALDVAGQRRRRARAALRRRSRSCCAPRQPAPPAAGSERQRVRGQLREVERPTPRRA